MTAPAKGTEKPNTPAHTQWRRTPRRNAVASVRSKGDSHDNAMAEVFNSLFKSECIRNPVMRRSGWRTVSDVEIAVAEYVDWYNHHRLQR